MNPDCDVNYLLNAAIENCNCRKLIDSFNLNELNEKHLDHIYKKIREYLSVENLNSNDLVQDGSLISNVLQVLWDLIGDLNINSEILSLNLAKSVLLIITDEHCSIKNMKTALHIFNATIQISNVVNNIVTDDTLEGLLQILGRKVSSVGDYECQAAFIEALCRIASQENSLYWINVWFPEPTARAMFSSINPEKFECSLRQLLNYINRNEPERRVFSFIAQSVSFGSVQLKKPKECDMWIDFNYDSESISFYCSECSLQCLQNSSEYPEMWETIVIDYSSLAGFFVKERKAEKKIEVILLLNSPCYTLSTLSNATHPELHPEFHKNRVTIVFWDLLDIYPHLEAIYGKDKHMTQLSAEKTTKLSPSADVDNITNERRDVLSNEFSSQRKVSNLTSPICIDACENEVLSNEFPSQRKVSNLTSPICIDACENEVLSNEFPSLRKVSNLTSPICIDACENGDFLPDSDVNQTFSVFRKVSESTEKIHFTSEDLKNEGTRKISESSELIQVDISVSNIDESPNVLHKSPKNFTGTFSKRKASQSSTKIVKEIKGKTVVPKIEGKKKRMSRTVKNQNKESLYVLTNTSNLSPNFEKNSKEDWIEKDFKLTYKRFSKSNEKKPFSPKTHFDVDEGYKTDIPVVISNECPKGVKKKVVFENTFDRKESGSVSNKKYDETHKEIKDPMQSPSVIEESLPKIERKKKRGRKIVKNQNKESLYVLTKASNPIPNFEKNNELVEQDFKLTHKSFSKSNEKQPFSPKTYFDGCKTEIPVAISNESPKHVGKIAALEDEFDRNEYNETNKEICDPLHSPSVVEESLNVETLFPSNIPVEDKSCTFSAQPEDTLKYKDNKKADESKEENQETENKLMKLSKGIGSRNENIISKTGPNLLREKDNQISVMKLRSSDHIESQKVCDKAEKRASTSSKETDCSEGSSKFQRKKVRLYNLESAPLYDVPPIISSNDASLQENVPCKSNLPEPDKGNISENAVKPFELRTKRKAESDGKKYSARRKRTKSSDQNELPTIGQPMQLFNDFPVSDEDFEEHAIRDRHIRRKRKISETSSTVHEQNVTGDRKADVLLSTEEKKPAKKQRKAAVKAMKRTKEILDRKLEVARDISVYDIIEDMDGFEKNSVSASKTLKRKLSKSDTDTHSSEVSWMKQRKSYLFESPKKNYSDWRKSLHKKKELPVKVVSDTSVKKTSVKKNSLKRKKESNRSDSNIDAKSFGFSELENYYLSVEKNCNRSSHSVMKDFESDLCELAKENTTEKSLSVIDFNSNAEIDHSRKKFKTNYKISNTEKKKKSATASEVSNDAKKDLDPEKELNNELNYNEVECDNNGNTNEHIASSTHHVECSEEENAVECEETQSKHTLEDVREQLICGYPIDKLEAVTENKGKFMILQRFLKSVAEYSDKTKDSSKSSLQETVSSSDLCRPHLSCKSFSDGIEIAKFYESSENQVVHDNNLTVQYPSEENADNLEEPDDSVNKNDQSPMIRKLSCSGGFDRIQCLSPYDEVSEKATSMEPKAASDLSSHDQHLLTKMQFMVDALKASIGPRSASDLIVDSSDHQQKKRSKSVDEKVRKKCQSNSEKSSSKQEKFSKKWKRQKKSKDIKNSSFSSLCSQITSTSMIDALKDKKWLQEITSLLSQNACNLSRKILATVQVCFAEFCYKMSTLRENLVKTAKIFELPLSQDEYKLKSFIKSCKIVRLEVEKSLIRMRSVGKEYFEAEERDYRRLRKKQIKANKKYFQSMQKIKQNSIARMEQKVLYKTNYFLKKLHMHIDSA